MKRPLKLLVIEDEVLIGLYMKTELERNGYEVIGQASRGEDAIRMVREKQPDFVLLDIRLSGNLDGIETAAIIRKESNIPLIFLSGYNTPQVVERAMEVKPLGFLVKPLKIDQLLQLTENISV